MAGRRETERRLRALADIGSILGVMKNLALMETGKLSRFLIAQREMVASLEATAADFLAFYPQPYVALAETDVILLIGSQRGLCGDFNDLLLAALPKLVNNVSRPLIISVGDKLAGRLQTDAHLDGAHAVEEIGQVIHAVMDTMTVLVKRSDAADLLRLSALCHDPDSGSVVFRRLAPLSGEDRPESPGLCPPHLNIAPGKFFIALTEELLMAGITELFHRSLMAESRFRLNHIESASRRMERRADELKRKQSLARQEEIIEEIEAILAGVGLEESGF